MPPLTIRRRASLEPSSPETSPSSTSTASIKSKRRTSKPSQEFTTLFTNLDDIARINSFLGIASAATRVNLNSVMKKLSEELRSSLIEFIDVVELKICAVLLRVMDELSESDAEHVFMLQWEDHVSFERYIQIINLPLVELTSFLNTMYNLIQSDRTNVLKTASACDMPLHTLQNLLNTITYTKHKCQLCAARKSILKDVNRINNYSYISSNHSHNQTTTMYDNEITDLRQYTQNPLSDFYSLQHNANTNVTKIVYTDKSQVNIRSNTFEVDTKLLCKDCKSSVYQFALRSGNDLEIWHALWNARLSLRERALKTDKAKAVWWAGEVKEVEFGNVVSAIVVGNGNVKKRIREELCRNEEKKRIAVVKKNLWTKKEIKQTLLKTATKSDTKWVQQDLTSNIKQLMIRNLSASLEFETEYGLHVNAQKDRYNSRSTKRTVTHNGSGIPLTKEAASVVFGTSLITIEDESDDLKKWNDDYMIKRDMLDWRVEETRRQLANSTNENFKEKTASWLFDAKGVDDKILGKAEKIRLEKEGRVKEREEKKRTNVLYRQEMREIARTRNIEDNRVETIRLKLKVDEEKVEAKERLGLACAEAEQRGGGDRYWGIPTEFERKRRLDEFVRRQYEFKVIDKRAMMVAVGGEIAVSKEVAEGVPLVLGIDRRQIRTLVVSTSENCEDPLGLRRKPVGQR